VQNKIKVKGRAAMSVKMLDHYMRVYIVPRTRFHDHLDTLVPGEAVHAMRKNHVAYMLQKFDPDPPRQLWDLVREPTEAPVGLASALPAAQQAGAIAEEVRRAIDEVRADQAA
jgi:hypothetical protein